MAADEWVVVRLKLQDRNRFIADTRAAGQAVKQMGREAQTTGGLFRQGAHHGFIWNQALFTLRRTIYGLTLATAGLGAAAVYSGFQYNSLIEQQTLAFKILTGGAKSAHREVNFLFNLAAKGPFQFNQVIQGARQLMAFGFQAQRANQILVSLQDAMAGMGLDQSQLERATLALGQIQSSGRLLGQDLRQLEQLGLVNLRDMAKRLGVNPQQLASNAGSLGIPSRYAIDAILAYWRTKFHGAAREFQSTWVGLTSTIKDYGSQMFGAITYPLFRDLEKNFLPKIRNQIQLVTSYYQRTRAKGETPTFGGALGVLDQRYGTNLQQTWMRLTSIGRQFLEVWLIVVKSMVRALQILHVSDMTFTALGAILWSIATVLKVLQPILPYLIAAWIAERVALTALTIVQRRALVTDALMVMWTKRKIFWTRVWTGVMGMQGGSIMGLFRNWKRYGMATKEVWDAERKIYVTTNANTGLMGKLSRLLFGRLVPAFTAAATAAWGFTAAMLADPLTWIIVGVVALTAGLVILYLKWKPFHDLVNNTWHWIRENWRWSTLFLGLFGPLGWITAGIANLAGSWKMLYGWIRATVNILQRGWGFLKHIGSGIWHGITSHIPGHAFGGVMGAHGPALVGERGPELVSLPAGAAISPLSTKRAMDLGPLVGHSRGGILQIKIPLYLDSRQIAEANAQASLDSLARA